MVQNTDPRNYAKCEDERHNPLLSFLKWANIPNEPKLHTFNIQPLQLHQHGLCKFIPLVLKENVKSVNLSTKNMGRDKAILTNNAHLKQFYSLTKKFLYNYALYWTKSLQKHRKL